MAKIGVIHYNFPGFSFQQFLSFAGECGYGFVELQAPDVWSPEVEDPERNAELVRRQVESFGLRVSALAAQNDFIQPDQDGILSQVVRMKRVCGLAQILDDEAVVRSEGGAPKDSVPQEMWLDAMYSCFSRCGEFAESMGVGIAIDNHGWVTNNGDLLHSLLERIDHPLIGTNLDTMNYRWFGNDIPTCNRYYEMMAPHALHTHIKDGKGSRQGYVGADLGDGEIDLGHAISCLKNAGFDGVWCAEYEGPEAEGGAGYRKCCAWLRKHV